MENFDTSVTDYLTLTLQQVLEIPSFPGSACDARLAVISLNLRALASNFLAIDTAEVPLTVDLKKVALGLLGTADFAEAALPEGIMEY